MDDYSLFWSILVPAAVLLLTIIATVKIYRDMTVPEPAEQQDQDT